MSSHTSDRTVFVVVFIAIALIGSVYAYWFFSTHKRVVETERGGFSREAYSDEFLAWKRFQTKAIAEPVQLQSISDLQLEDARTTFLFSPKLHEQLSKQDREHLLKWLEHGGHLLTVVYTIWDDDTQQSGDEFLDQLGLRQKMYNELPEQPANNTETDDFSDQASIVDLSQLGAERELAIDFDHYFYFEDTPNATYQVADEYGIHLVELAVGQGTITVLTDAEMWRNYSIEQNDNAYFAWLLAAQHSPEKLLFFDEFRATPLTTLMWQHGWPVVISLIISIPLMLWALYNRFGPIQATNTTIQRSMREHLLASGRFFWQNKHIEALLQPIRQRISRKVLRHVPHWTEWSANQQLAWLHEFSNISIERLDYLMHGEPRKERDLVSVIHQLHQIEHQL